MQAPRHGLVLARHRPPQLQPLCQPDHRHTPIRQRSRITAGSGSARQPRKDCRTFSTSPPRLFLPSPSSSLSSNRWTSRQAGDQFARAARVQGLKSRAAFKLLELDVKHRLFRRGGVVVDLGFAPGSWSQVAAERVGRRGRVVGIDVIPAQPPRGVSTIQGDFLQPGVRAMVGAFVLDVGRDREREMRARAGAGADAGADADADARAPDGGLHGRPDGPDAEPRGPHALEDVLLDRPSYIDMERHATEDAAVAGDDSRTASSRPVDLVLSDMSAPWPQTHGFSANSLSNPHFRMMNTSGIAFADHAGSIDLCLAALSFAADTLKTGGHFVCKFYQGVEDRLLEGKLRAMFANVHREKPEASRSVSRCRPGSMSWVLMKPQESKEAYFVALRRKADR